MAAGAPRVWSATPAECRPGMPHPQIAFVPDQGREHITPGRSHPPYNSNPPTSGWHYTAKAPGGFHRRELPDEFLVHNLEHGEIWISYRDAADADVIAALERLAREIPDQLVITPRRKNDRRIAVAGWTRLMTLDCVHRDAILDFYRRFATRERNPVRP